MTKELWPEFKPGDNPLQATGQLYFDFMPDSWRRRYANGEETGGQFGHSAFTGDRLIPPRDRLPVRLFDLWTNRVVHTSTLDGRVDGYTIISHVWGDTLTEIDGAEYGVEWAIPIRRRVKMEQLLKVARIIGGQRYLWIDILCLDQRPNQMREAEIPRMGDYYSNAAGCIVWLDNAYGELGWETVLSAIKDINGFFNQDHAGIPSITVDQMLRDGLLNVSLSAEEAFKLLRRVLTIEKAPWFQRVWTLQEAVLPNSIYLCTPERYLVNGGQLFQLLGLCGMVSKLFLDMGSMAGMALLHELQKSESWKLLRLRQLWRKSQLGYWHLTIALRSRKCKFEQDRVFGTLALLPNSPATAVDYRLDAGNLFRELWKDAVNKGEFGALRFLGDAYRSGAPNESCTAELMPVAEKDPPIETHKLYVRPLGVFLENVGIDPVTTVQVIIANGSLRSWPAPEFLSLPASAHIDMAKAFGVSSDVVGEAGLLCPGAFAALSALGPLPPDILKAFGEEFMEKYELAIPRGMLGWVRSTILMAVCQEDHAWVVINTRSSGPQLALVTERVEGNVVVVTPSSYLETPGDGCIICKVTPNGELQKIGLGMGDAVKASSLASALLI